MEAYVVVVDTGSFSAASRRLGEPRSEHQGEKEIEVILAHLERQNDMLLFMLEKQGLKLDEVLPARRAAPRSTGHSGRRRRE
jgi:hypothetical protein